MKDEIILFGTIFTAMTMISFASYHLGKDAMKREAIVAGHALWTYDETGNPKFYWKDQETFIRQSK